MVLKDQVKNYAKKLVEDRPDAATLRRWSGFESRSPFASPMMASSPTTRAFRCWSIAAASRLRASGLIRRQSSIACSMPTAGAVHGATQSTISCTTIRKFMK